MTQLLPAPFPLVLLKQEEEEEEDVGRLPNIASLNQLTSDHHHEQQGLQPHQIKVEDKSTAYGFGEAVVHNEPVFVKWVSSDVRLMQKMMNSSPSSTSAINKPTQISSRDQELQYDKSETTSSSATNHSIHTMNRMIAATTGSSVRVCSDCSTTTTPLWRSGPLGPKSLCNACGIRQRKARPAAAMEEESGGATSGSVHQVEGSGSSISMKKNKSNKLKINKFALKLSKSC